MTNDQSHERYAVYYAPEPQTPLARFGAAWLRPVGGIGALGGTHHVPRETVGLDEAYADKITAKPARYGLHATLKAPFRPAPGIRQADVFAAVARLARSRAPAVAGPLRVMTIGPFLALCPDGATTAINDLAAACVTELDPLRAPLTPEDRARRNPDALDPRGRELLETWGYPHVLDRFRFHITLTDALEPDDRARVASALDRRLAPMIGEAPFRIASLCVYGDPGGGGPFRLLDRYPLAA